MMKKIVCAFAFSVLMVFILAGCDENRYENLTGTVTEVKVSDGYKYPIYTILTPENHTVNVTLKQDGAVISFGNDMPDAKCLETGYISEYDCIGICCDYDAAKARKSSDDIIEVSSMYIDRVLYKNAVILSDKTPVDMWDNCGFYQSYHLADGTELLKDYRPKYLDALSVVSVPTEYKALLSQQAVDNILDFYSENSLLFDNKPYIEKAYARYLESEDKAEFESFDLTLGTVMTAVSDKNAYFSVSITIPNEKGENEQKQWGVAFDRDSGEYLDFWSLFKCGKNDAEQVIIEAVFNTIEKDSGLTKEILAENFDASCVIFWQDSIEIWYPKGTLPKTDYEFGIGIDGENMEKIYSIMHNWAVPHSLQDK